MTTRSTGRRPAAAAKAPTTAVARTSRTKAAAIPATTGRRPAASAKAAPATRKPAATAPAKAPARRTAATAPAKASTRRTAVSQAPAKRKPAATAPAVKTTTQVAKVMTTANYNSGIPTGRTAWGVAPDFTNCKLDLKFQIGDDGLPTKISVHRVKGSNYLEPLPKNVSNVAVDDAPTYAAIASRLGAAIMITKTASRLTPGSNFRAIFNLGYSSVRQTATCSLKELYILAKVKGTTRALALDKTDVRYRRIRRATQFLPGAMVNSVNPF